MNDFILIVDDNIENLKVLGSTLIEQGYRIAIAKSGPETLELTSNLTPSLILLDVMMPGMDGFELARLLRQKEGYEDIPIIFLTAKAETEDIVKGFESGGNDYVTKPFNASELRARIKNHLDLKYAKDQIEAQAKELKTLNSFQNRLFSVISHDVRTPLATINILLQNLKTDTSVLLPDKIMNHLNLMDALTSETYQMLNNMFQWARYQIHNPKVTKVDYDISEQIVKTIRLYETMANHKKINIIYTDTRKTYVYADENMVQIVLRNLINNAFKYSQPGSAITINSKTNEDVVTISVADQGIGMDSQELQNAFSEMEFHSAPGTQGEKGTGLGLKICAYFINLNDGKISASSKKGDGSTFQFSLPVKNNK